jgi:hypothetical protein
VFYRVGIGHGLECFGARSEREAVVRPSI